MLQALIIVFREGFESFLTVAIIFAYLRKTGRDWPRPAVWWGIGVAVIVSAILGYWLKNVSNQPLWEGILALMAAVLVATFVIHIWRVAPTMKREMEAKLEARASIESAPWAWVGIFFFTVLMIAREGMETVLLLIQVRQGNFWLGCAMGLALAAARRRALRDAVRRLPGRCPRLLEALLSPDDPTYREIAGELGISQGSLGPERSRCLGCLRRLLTPEVAARSARG